MVEISKRYLVAHIKLSKATSAWQKGVKWYAKELAEEHLEDDYIQLITKDNVVDVSRLHETLLCGARDWKEYSWGGCALIYDEDIAHTLCTPSELRRTEEGYKKPNKREEWLDVQTRALHQAEHLIFKMLSSMLQRNNWENFESEVK